MGGRKAAMADQRLRQEQEIRDAKHDVELPRKASDSQRGSQERQTEAVADVRKVVGQLAGDLANLRICHQKKVAVGQESGKLLERTSSFGWRSLD
jgi:hypothetical protein